MNTHGVWWWWFLWPPRSKICWNEKCYCYSFQGTRTDTDDASQASSEAEILEPTSPVELQPQDSVAVSVRDADIAVENGDAVGEEKPEKGSPVQTVQEPVRR